MEVHCIDGDDSEVIRGELENVTTAHRKSTVMEASTDTGRSSEVSVVCSALLSIQLLYELHTCMYVHASYMLCCGSILLILCPCLL